MQSVQIDITGDTTLLMHADTLADPLREVTKAFKKVSSKRVKTDSDHEEMARAEFKAGLYLDHEGAVCIPNRNIMKCLTEGARITKSGAKIERGLTITALTFPLQYKGPRDPDALYADRNFRSRMSVRVGTAKTMRCRPQFNGWSLSVTAMIDETVLSLAELQDIAKNAGAMIGLGDYRKGGGFGRFTATVRAA